MAGGLALIAHRKDIDGLRAIAVIPVVLYHAGLPAISGGLVGVDVFFVISGYLITTIIRDELSARRFTLIGFYERRARRLLPALLFMMAACFAAAWVLLPPDRFTDFAASAAATATFSSNFWFWLFSGGYFADAANYLPLLHTWSLAIEEQFYILFPFLLIAIARFNRLVSFAIISALTFASLLISILAVLYWPAAGFYLLPARAWELGIGALIVLAPMPTIRLRWVREVVAGVGLLAIILAVLTYDEGAPFAGLAVFAACLGTAALIGVGANGATLTSTLLSWRPLVFCGLISYSLYLWHWPILSFLRVRLQSVDLSFEQGAVAVLAAIIMAVVSWALMERPFRNRAFLNRPTIFALSGAGIIATLAASAFIWAGSGLPGRISPQALAALAFANDGNTRREECFGVEPPRELCRLGGETTGKADFLLWGDSHADALFPGMDLAAQQTDRSGLYAARSGCAPLVGVQPQVARARSQSWCRTFNDAVIEMLRQRPGDLGTVIITARWSVWESGARSGPYYQGPSMILIDDRYPQGSTQTNAIVFEAGLRRTVDAILETGRKVVILADVPEIGWNVPNHLYLNQRWGDPLPPAPTPDAVSERQAGVRAVFSKLARMPGVEVIPLAPALCDETCLVMLRGRALYFDGDHLSAFAARELIAPVLASEVLRKIDVTTQ